MHRESLIAEIDQEISRLQEVRKILADGRSSTSAVLPKVKAASAAHKKRSLSPEARAKIAAAQKKRWAAQKKAAKHIR